MVARRSCSSAMTTAIAMTRRRSVPLSRRAPGSPAFTDASSVARQRKLPTRNPSARTRSATRKRGTNAEEFLDEPLKRSELQRVYGRDDEADPDDPEDDLRDQQLGAWHLGDAQHLAGAGAQRQTIEPQPREQSLDGAARDNRHDETAGKDDGAATRRGTNSTKAVAKLRQDCTSASAIS